MARPLRQRLHLVFALAALFLQPVLASADAVTVNVLSAVVKDQKIPGATVLIQRNGATTVQGTTSADGSVRIEQPFADNADSLLIIQKPGYSSLVVRCPCSNLTYALSPVMTGLDGMRVVLSWGAEPRDLDLHMVSPSNDIYFDQKRGSDAELDVDDIDSYGPETITITKKRYGDAYVFAVHDYTHKFSSPDPSAGGAHLNHSDAQVFVYVGESLVRRYHVPSGEGNLWTVFRLTPNGEFEDINTVSTIGVTGDIVGHTMTPHLGGAAQSALAAGQTATPTAGAAQPGAPAASTTSGASDADRATATALNKQGEQAYHAGRLDDAIRFYLDAIDKWPGYGQAFSNLGLVYQKQEKTAEAIWANRKAIALASGPSAATVRASSYYNIARIYENARQWDDALRHYELARQQKANPVYDKAIERVHASMQAN